MKVLYITEKFLKSFLIVFFFLLLINVAFTKSGEDIYKACCITCHSPQMAKLFQAPAAHSEDWVVRKDLHVKYLIEKGMVFNNDFNEKENAILDSLVASATNGTPNGMPPKGTCIDCSKDELKSAIMFMISR